MTSTKTHMSSGKAAAIVSAALLLPQSGARPDEQAAANCVPPANARYGDACVHANNPSVACKVLHQSKSAKSTQSATAKSGKADYKSGKAGSKSGKGNGAPVKLYYDDSGCVQAKDLELGKCNNDLCVDDTESEGCAHVEMCTQRHSAGNSCKDCPNVKFFKHLYGDA